MSHAQVGQSSTFFEKNHGKRGVASQQPEQIAKTVLKANKFFSKCLVGLEWSGTVHFLLYRPKRADFDHQQLYRKGTQF